MSQLILLDLLIDLGRIVRERDHPRQLRLNHMREFVETFPIDPEGVRPFPHLVKVATYMLSTEVHVHVVVTLDPVIEDQTRVCVAHERLTEKVDAVVY